MVDRSGDVVDDLQRDRQAAVLCVQISLLLCRERGSHCPTGDEAGEGGAKEELDTFALKRGHEDIPDRRRRRICARLRGHRGVVREARESLGERRRRREARLVDEHGLRSVARGRIVNLGVDDDAEGLGDVGGDVDVDVANALGVAHDRDFGALLDGPHEL